METKKSQDAQIVFGDTPGRIADKSHAALAKIVEPTGVVVDGSVARGRQRVDRKIASFGIGLPVAAEFNLGMAAVGLDVLAQGRHLERMLFYNDSDRAMLDTGGNRLEPGGGHPFNNLVRHRRGGNVDLGRWHSEQRI